MASDKAIDTAKPAVRSADVTERLKKASEGVIAYKQLINNYKDPAGAPIYEDGYIFDTALPSGKFKLDATDALDTDFHDANKRYLNRLIGEIEKYAPYLDIKLGDQRAKIGDVYDGLRDVDDHHAEYWTFNKQQYIQAFLQNVDRIPDLDAKMGENSRKNPRAGAHYHTKTQKEIRELIPALREFLSFNQSEIDGKKATPSAYHVIALRDSIITAQKFMNGPLGPLSKVPEDGIIDNKFIAGFSHELNYLQTDILNPDNAKKYKFMIDHPEHGHSLKMDVENANGKPVGFSFQKKSGYGFAFDIESGQYLCIAKDAQTGKDTLQKAAAIKITSDGTPTFLKVDTVKNELVPFDAKPLQPFQDPLYKTIELLAGRNPKDDRVVGFAKIVQGFDKKALQSIKDDVEKLHKFEADLAKNRELVTLKSVAADLVANNFVNGIKVFDPKKDALKPDQAEFVAVARGIFESTQAFLATKPPILMAASLPKPDTIATTDPQIAMQRNLRMALPDLLATTKITGTFQDKSHAALSAALMGMYNLKPQDMGKFNPATSPLNDSFMQADFPVPANYKSKEDYVRGIAGNMHQMLAFHDLYSRLPANQRTALDTALKPPVVVAPAPTPPPVASPPVAAPKIIETPKPASLPPVVEKQKTDPAIYAGGALFSTVVLGQLEKYEKTTAWRIMGKTGDSAKDNKILNIGEALIGGMERAAGTLGIKKPDISRALLEGRFNPSTDDLNLVYHGLKRQAAEKDLFGEGKQYKTEAEAANALWNENFGALKGIGAINTIVNGQKISLTAEDIALHTLIRSESPAFIQTMKAAGFDVENRGFEITHTDGTAFAKTDGPDHKVIRYRDVLDRLGDGNESLLKPQIDKILNEKTVLLYINYILPSKDPKIDDKGDYHLLREQFKNNPKPTADVEDTARMEKIAEMAAAALEMVEPQDYSPEPAATGGPGIKFKV